jgi:hypothetical protein
MVLSQDVARVTGYGSASGCMSNDKFSVTGSVQAASVVLSFATTNGQTIGKTETFHYQYVNGRLTSANKDDSIWGRHDFRRTEDIPELKRLLDLMKKEPQPTDAAAASRGQ